MFDMNEIKDIKNKEHKEKSNKIAHVVFYFPLSNQLANNEPLPTKQTNSGNNQ